MLPPDYEVSFIRYAIRFEKVGLFELFNINRGLCVFIIIINCSFYVKYYTDLTWICRNTGEKTGAHSYFNSEWIISIR